MVERKHDEVGVETVDHGGGIHMVLRVAADMRIYFMLAFARFIGSAHHRIWEPLFHGSGKLLHEERSRSDGNCAPFSLVFFHARTKERFVSANSLLIELGDGRHAIKCNENAITWLHEVDVLLDFTTNLVNQPRLEVFRFDPLRFHHPHRIIYD